METRTRRWLVPSGAAVAVLVVLALVWALRPGVGDEPGFAGSGPSTPPSDTATVAPDSPGSEPGSSGDPDLPDGGLTPAPGPDLPPAPDSQAIESYFPRDGSTLAMNYTSGVPECYGRVGDPIVEETADAVVVTLPKTMPKQGGDVACIDIALTASVDVELSLPLGDRAVLDGSREDVEVDRADAAYGEISRNGGSDQAY